jgi:hypothetical protein
MQVRVGTVGGEVYNNNDRPPRRFAPGRRCAERECATRLSIYNAGEYCSLHAVKLAPRIRGKKVR